MLCTFSTEHGALVIRSDDIRAISDGADGSTLLRWDICGQEVQCLIVGAATENMERIQREELDLIARVEAHRYQTQRALQMPQPVARGKARP